MACNAVTLDRLRDEFKLCVRAHQGLFVGVKAVVIGNPRRHHLDEGAPIAIAMSTETALNKAPRTDSNARRPPPLVIIGCAVLAIACSGSETPADGAMRDVPTVDVALSDDAPLDATSDAAQTLDALARDTSDAGLSDADLTEIDDRPAPRTDGGDASDIPDATRDVAPIDVPPIDVPPIDVPPIDVPPIDVPPIDVAPVDVPPIDVPLVDPLAGRGTVARVRSGFMFTEGPQWRSREGDLLFSDIPANTIFRLDGAGAFTMFRTPSDNSNGLAVDSTGRLLAAEHGSRSVTRTRPDGTRETLASHFSDGGMRRRLNSPNDLIVRSDGTVYFTDPPYGITTAQQELTFNGVYRVTPSGTLTAEWRGALTARPNGVALSPDERTLYVADTADGMVRAWDVQPDGALTRLRTLARTSGNPDGMTVDLAGNLYVSTRTGIQVFSAAGREWGVIAIPEQPANCAFGGADARVLYVTARTGLYRVSLAGPGLY